MSFIPNSIFYPEFTTGLTSQDYIQRVQGTLHHRLALSFYPNQITRRASTVPPVIIRKFSPDGKYLISFSHHYRAISAYHYGRRDDISLSEKSEHGRCLDFDDFFTLAYESKLFTGVEILCLDFCLFTQDWKYMILASSVSATEEDVEGNDNISFWILSLDSGSIVDSIHFPNDHIYLYNHTGVSLFEDLFAVTSVHHQAVHVFKIASTGHFKPAFTLGCHETPEEKRELESIYQESATMDEVVEDDTPGETVSGFAQKVLCFLFRQAYGDDQIKDPYQRAKDLSYFYAHFCHFEVMTVWRASWLDRNHVLLKMGSPDAVNWMHEQSAESLNHVIFFGIYSLEKEGFIALFDNASLDFASLVASSPEFSAGAALCRSPAQKYDDLLFGTAGVPSNQHSSWQVYQNMFSAISKSQRGGPFKAAVRCLTSFPDAPQTVANSPLLDLDVYTFDPSILSYIGHVRRCPTFSFKFCDKRTGAFKFQIDPFPMSEDDPSCILAIDRDPEQ